MYRCTCVCMCVTCTAETPTLDMLQLLQLHHNHFSKYSIVLMYITEVVCTSLAHTFLSSLLDTYILDVYYTAILALHW